MSTSSKEYKVADQQKESYNMLVSLVIKTYYFWLISDTVLNNQQTLLCTGSRFHTAMHQVETGRTATDATRVWSSHNCLVRMKFLTGRPEWPCGQAASWPLSPLGTPRTSSSSGAGTTQPLPTLQGREVPKPQALFLSSSKTQRGVYQS